MHPVPFEQASNQNSLRLQDTGITVLSHPISVNCRSCWDATPAKGAVGKTRCDQAAQYFAKILKEDDEIELLVDEMKEHKVYF